ncbi:MAG: DUF3365 domain-containing protein [Acaryochloris sp. RU_4_1]|nr:DUF3365 domain-containing protein [Acaryochloris sp. RU_4_1]
MLNSITRVLGGVCVVIVLFCTFPQLAQAQTEPAQLAHAVQEIEGLDALRSGLASSLEGQTEEPTQQTMKEVCKPVGMKAQQLSQENGWQVKQIAKKYRNPAHAPDNSESQMVLAQFAKQPDQMGLWERETIDGESGSRYYRCINVEASCLACHGAKGKRPQFVQDNYPQDLAYDFKVGDLRGMYAVFIPDQQASLQDAANP